MPIPRITINHKTNYSMKDRTRFWRIALTLLTIIDVIFIYAFYIIDINGILAFLLCVGLGGAYLIFCGFAIYCLSKTYRLRNKLEKKFFTWSLIALSLLPIAHGTYHAWLYFFPPTATFDLPSNEILKVTVDRLEWGKKDSVQTSYINLGEFNQDYSLVITKDDTLFVWPSELEDSVHCQRYHVGHLHLSDNYYEGKGEFDKAVSFDKIKWKYEYVYMLDGIFTGGTQTLSVPKPDSIDIHWRSISDPKRIDKYHTSDNIRSSY